MRRLTVKTSSLSEQAERFDFSSHSLHPPGLYGLAFICGELLASRKRERWGREAAPQTGGTDWLICLLVLWRKTYLATKLQTTQPFIPVSVTPWMKYFWAKKKMRITGVIMSSEPAISILVVTPPSTLKANRPSASG